MEQTIDPNEKISEQIENIFEDIPYSDWEKIDPEVLKKQDIDDPIEFKEAGAIPAKWLIGQLGLAGFSIGYVEISQENPNTIINLSNANIGNLIQLVSYIKTQVRDKIGIQLVDHIL